MQAQFLQKVRLWVDTYREVNMTQAFEFNPITFGGDPDEVELSRIIAGILSPRGRHAQNGTFLYPFLKRLGLEVRLDCRHAEVDTERWQANGRDRLDIVVIIHGVLHLVIENKPWAGDGIDQVKRYLGNLDVCNEPLRLVLYLSANGTTPSSIREPELGIRMSAGQLKLWSYSKDVPAWLEVCRAECKAPKVSSYIDSFVGYVKSEFSGERNSTMDDFIGSSCRNSNEDILAMLRCERPIALYKKDQTEKLQDQLRNLLPEYEIKLTFDGNKFVCNIIFSRQSPYYLEIACGEGAWYGVHRKNQGINDGPEFQALNNLALGRGTERSWYVWWRLPSETDPVLQIHRDWRKNPEAWLEIASGELARKIVDAFERLHSVLKENGAG
jgi:hypothetical protein